MASAFQALECAADCRELTVDDCHPFLVNCGGERLQALTCTPLHPPCEQIPDIKGIAEQYTALTKLVLQGYDFVVETRPDFELLRTLELQELVIRSCPGMAYDILVPNFPCDFSNLQKLCIWEDDDSTEIDEYRDALSNPDSKARCEVLDYRDLRAAVFRLPKLMQLSGVGKLFLLLDRYSWKGWHKSKEAPVRANWPLADDMTVWLKNSKRA